jgi:hypothetical protein
VADNVSFQTTAATPASGTKVVADQVTYSGDSTAYLQITRQVAVTGAEGSKTVVELYGTRSDTYVAVGDGTALDATTRPWRSFSMQVTGTTAAADDWSVVLEGSLDGVTYATILTHDFDTHDDGAMVWGDAVACPVLYLRSRCVSLTLGSATNVVAVILGVP